MNNRNIVPAVNVQQDEISNEMSAAEFQQRLYSWFEDRGLLSELRAHLRKQMISVLKDTVSTQARQTISPKLQAVNLLIAEFLLRQDYHYSLSVFSTEVPLVNVLPDFPGLTLNSYGNAGSQNDITNKKWQFSEKDARDILETLGFHHDTNEGQSVLMTYYNNNTTKEPLLTCIIRALHTARYKSQSNLLIRESSNNIKEASSNINNNCELWLKNISELLNSNNITEQTSEDILKILKETIDAEKRRLKQDAREEYLKLQFALQLQANKREEEQKMKVLQAQKALDVEKARWHTTRQRDADDFRNRMLHHKNIIRERYQELSAREADIQEREQGVRQREMYLQSLQQNLDFRLDTLTHERQNITELQDRLNHELQEKQRNAKHDAEFLKGLQDECVSMKSQINHTQEAVVNATKVSQNDDEEHNMRNLITQLQLENADLRNLNSEQQTRIEELSQRATHLMRDLDSRRLSRSGILTAPPLTAPPNLLRHNGNSWSGAGEEGFRPSPPASPREYRHLHMSRDSKRRIPPRRLTIHGSNSSNDHSPTNEILLEARERLRRLEQEGEDVDRQYRLFKTRHQAQTDYYNYYRSLQQHNVFGSYFGNPYDRQGYGLNLQQENMPQVFVNGSPHDTEPSGLSHISGYSDDANYYTSMNHYSNHNQQEIDGVGSSPQIIELHSNFKSNNAGQQAESNIEENLKNKESEDDKIVNDTPSLASSGILGDILAAGTSGVSLSGIDMTDEKSESPLEDKPTEEN